jgi:hypothetical protein
MGIDCDHYSGAIVNYEPFFNGYIITRQDGGIRNHLLVDAVLQGSQVEVGISRKETEDNAGSMETSQTV